MTLKTLSFINKIVTFIKPKDEFKPFIKKLWLGFSISIVLIVLFFTLISFGVFGFMPKIAVLENPPINYATEIYSEDNVLLGVFYKEENRINITYDELSPYLINALVCTEDVRFAKHSGIDFRGLARVIVKTVIGGNKNSGGGSTISQQLAKMLFPRENLTNKFTFAVRKFREWIIATKIEKSYTKEEIVALYLNKFDFLNNAVGIKAASKVYFNKSPKQLKPQEAAMLVGMVKGPALFNPISHPDTTKHRRNVVMKQMVKYGTLSQERYDSLRLLPLGITRMHIDNNHGIAPYFREYLKKYISAEKPSPSKMSKSKYAEDSLRWETDPVYGWLNKNKKPDGTYYNLYTDGLKIHTTINAEMQKAAEEAVHDHMQHLQRNLEAQTRSNPNYPFDKSLKGTKLYKTMLQDMYGTDMYDRLKSYYTSDDKIIEALKKKRKRTIFTYRGEIQDEMTGFDSLRIMKRKLHTGVLSLEPHTGKIKAYVGGINFKNYKFDHIYMQKRQVGSTFKPFLYTLAIESGLDPCFKMLNSPITMFVNDKPWTPNNADDDKLGEMVNLTWALAHSNNYISARLIKRFGPLPLIKLVRNLGIKSRIPEVPSICLGVAELSLYEMTTTYTIFANNGIKVSPIFISKITDKHGNSLGEFKPTRKEVLSATTAYTVNRMMQGVINEKGGTGGRIRWKYNFKAEIAGKTGTTNKQTDGWFIGITPKLVTGVWVGGEDSNVRFKSITWGQGANTALPIWAEYMKKVYEINETDYSEEDTFLPPTEFSESYFNCQDDDDDLLR